MAETKSTMVPLGAPAPEFTLRDTEGALISLQDFKNHKGLVVMFICNHCPFVKLLQRSLAAFGKEYQEKGLGVVAISANDITTHPDDSPEKMATVKRELGFTFPYLYDASQEVAKSYKAACTPDFFLYDGDLKLAYRGQFDDARPGNDIQPTGNDLRAAADAVLAGKRPDPNQKPSIGCNIKWKAGNAPEYFAG